MQDEELRAAIAELKQQQLDLMSEVKKRRNKDLWEKLQALSPLMSGVLISSVGLYCTYTYNQQALKLQTIQTVEKFIPHLLGTEVSKKAAILAMSSLGNTEIAAKFGQLFASEGTVSALKSIAASDNNNNKDHIMVNKALANALDTVAEQYRVEKRYAQAEEAYKQALALKERTGGTADPDYSSNLEKLAQFYTAQGNYVQAEQLLKRSISLKEKRSGQNNVAEAYKSLADVYKLQGNLAEYELYMKKAAGLDTKALQTANDRKQQSADPSSTETVSGDVKKVDPNETKLEEKQPTPIADPGTIRSELPQTHQNASTTMFIDEDNGDLFKPAA
jgi:tetratricopeptide (TPR) repeat protein